MSDPIQPEALQDVMVPQRKLAFVWGDFEMQVRVRGAFTQI